MVANLLQVIEAEEKTRLEAIRPIPEFWPGDTVRVNVKIREGDRERVQAFEGVCISRAGGSVHENFTVRKISFGEGVERVFPILSPNIASIEVKRRGVVRRAKLYYLRDRRGKAARIAERVTVRPLLDGPGAMPPEIELGGNSAQTSSGPQLDISKMASALRSLMRHDHALSGAEVRALVSGVLDGLPETGVASSRRADAYQLAIGLGEHLGPLMFSEDKAVSGDARDAMQRLGRLFFGGEDRKDANVLARFLRHLDQRLICHVQVKSMRHGVALTVTARDLVRAATGEVGLTDGKDLPLQLFVEDAADRRIEEVARGSVGLRDRATLEHSVEGDRNALAGKFLTLLADGRDVYSARLETESDVLFVI